MPTYSTTQHKRTNSKFLVEQEKENDPELEEFKSFEAHVMMSPPKPYEREGPLAPELEETSGSLFLNESRMDKLQEKNNSRKFTVNEQTLNPSAEEPVRLLSYYSPYKQDRSRYSAKKTNVFKKTSPSK